MGQHSGIGVLDKTVAILEAAADGPAALTELVARTGIPRATVHRLAVALEVHRLLSRDLAGRFLCGPRLGELASFAGDPLIEHAAQVLDWVRTESGESAQLYQRSGTERICIATAERATGLRTTVALGARLPLSAGSGAQILSAWETAQEPAAAAGQAFGNRQLAEVRKRGWAQSVGQREAGVASVSAPVFGSEGRVIAAISISGPIERLGRSPGRRFAPILIDAAARLHAAVLQLPTPS